MTALASRRRAPNALVALAVAACGLVAACGTSTRSGPVEAAWTTDGGTDGSAEASDDGFSISTSLSSVIPTVATVTWSIADAGPLDDAYIEFGEAGTAYRMTAPAQVHGAAPYSTMLVGMKPKREYHFRITARSGAQSYVSEDQTVTTGNVPPELPDISVNVYDASKHARGFILSTLFAAPPAAVILDSDGDYVWWYLPGGVVRKLLLDRARMTADCQWIYMWSVNIAGAKEDADGGVSSQRIVKVRMDGSSEEEIPLPKGHHDFTILPDGTIAYIEFDIRTVNGMTVAGDRLMELRPDGTSVEVYSVWNDYQYTGLLPPPGEGWCHANFLEYHEDGDVYYLGSKNFSSILEIDRSTGELLHVLGGSRSDFTVSTGGTTPYEDQHGFQMKDGQLLVFDNGPQARMSTRAVQYAMDESSKVMTLTWSYTPTPTLFNFSMGNALFLPNGNRLVTFSTSGQIDEVDPGGSLVWRLNMGLGGALGYAVWKESLYE